VKFQALGKYIVEYDTSFLFQAVVNIHYMLKLVTFVSTSLYNQKCHL